MTDIDMNVWPWTDEELSFGRMLFMFASIAGHMNTLVRTTPIQDGWEVHLELPEV